MEMKTLTVNGQTYTVADPDAAHIDETSTAPDKTWSAEKLRGVLGDVETALDGILAIQNGLIGGSDQ